MNRRDFLRGAAALAASAVVPVVPVEADPLSAGMETLIDSAHSFAGAVGEIGRYETVRFVSTYPACNLTAEMLREMESALELLPGSIRATGARAEDGDPCEWFELVAVKHPESAHFKELLASVETICQAP